MKTNAQNPKPKKPAKTLDDEIAALQEKLARLQVQKREKERKELERNQKAIAAFLHAEKLDTIPVEKWTAALPALRRLLKALEQKGTAADAPSPPPAQTAGPANVEQGAAVDEPARTGTEEAVGQAS